MIQSINNQIPQQAVHNNGLEAQATVGEAQANFASMLKKAIDGVNQTQVASDQQTKALANGSVDDLHNVMIAAQKSSITLEATVQIQKKVVDAYKEMMSMQV
ncbi:MULTISPECIES: flagellar hook-basal body complex protein FliE [Virgibacillus]|uniref:flagellar hook-basal body complex protein FliE n=1 Tax=Virgibacillus TaxID=84406 RepID=UPI0003882B87|nr:MULTISPECIES: flagellar hook-basal body complex protein FliE [Virgibacillus]EQB36421.1 hypothetical protein M948_15430 [Virgibacillus sp. CM-4]MYL42254.1 flagellar hook-basal body complex protein FliE [Virgibacillus massiliensis]